MLINDEKVIIQAMHNYAVEIEIKKLFDDKIIGGTIHLSFGQEIIDSYMCLSFPDAMFFGNHRSHGQYLAATQDLKGLINQVLDNRTQHLYYSNKFLSTGIQGGLIPTAIGSALAFSKEGRKAVCFIGDGTTGEGTFYESLNMAKHFGLTNIIIVIIDNGFSMSQTKSIPELYSLARAFNFDYYYNCCSIPYLRQSTIFHYKTKRLCGHSCNDTQMYRDPEERTEKYFEDNSFISKIEGNLLNKYPDILEYTQRIIDEQLQIRNKQNT